MDYLSSRRSSQLSNEPLMISGYDILNMHIQNEKDAAECRAVTESSNRGETYYANDGRPGNEKISDFFPTRRSSDLKKYCIVILKQRAL